MALLAPQSVRIVLDKNLRATDPRETRERERETEKRLVVAQGWQAEENGE